MTEANKISWKRISVEGVVIVASILLAFAIDAWWSDRQDQNTERQILIDAITEFRENLEILDTDISANNAVYDYLVGVEAMSDSELMALSDEEASELFAIENQTNAAFDPARGSIDAVVRNGDLRFITDRELRGHLARWSALLTRSTRLELQHTNIQIDGLWKKVPTFKADGKWAIEERRETREMLVNSKATLRWVMDTMVELRDTAESIVERLQEVTQ